MSWGIHDLEGVEEVQRMIETNSEDQIPTMPVWMIMGISTKISVAQVSPPGHYFYAITDQIGFQASP